MSDAESTTGESNEPVTALINENVERVNETIDVGSPSVAHLTTQGLLEELQSLSDEDPEEEGTPAAASARAIAPHPADINGPCSVVATVHYVDWRRALSSEPVLNENHTPRVWSVRNALGENLYPGGSNSEINGMSVLHFFLLMFPSKQLVLMVDLTNDELEKLDVKLTNTSELLKVFGVLILMTSFEFTSRTSLWSFVAPMKYRPAPHFGHTRMSKHRFDDIFRAI